MRVSPVNYSMQNFMSRFKVMEERPNQYEQGLKSSEVLIEGDDIGVVDTKPNSDGKLYFTLKEGARTDAKYYFLGELNGLLSAMKHEDTNASGGLIITGS